MRLRRFRATTNILWDPPPGPDPILLLQPGKANNPDRMFHYTAIIGLP